jgi:hypothetical protein
MEMHTGDLVGKQEGKRPFVRHRGRWQYNIKKKYD